MGDRVKFYFVDTNVLMQCRALPEIDWRVFCDADDVRLVISRPVQTEIDNQKNKGGDRLARRARKASATIRNIILSDLEHATIKDADPSVTLWVDASTRPTPALSDQLDWNKPDDQLVGIVHAFSQQNPEASVFLLTHDTGPMATAKMVGVPIAPVPDDWLLPPEPSEADKKLRSLEVEVAKLKEQEPKFEITCLDSQGKENVKLHYDGIRYHPIAKKEISELMTQLKQKFPLATNFGSREPAERQSQSFMNILSYREVFTPVTAEEVYKYQSQHKEWLEDCEAFFSCLHKKLQNRYGILQFNFLISNNGTRPANDALVTFRAKGAIEIIPPPYHLGNDVEEQKSDTELVLPKPPESPQGNWHPASFNYASTLNLIRDFQQHSDSLTGGPNLYESLARDMRLDKRDPNGFYYKPNRPSVASQEFMLECEQWRHGHEPQSFTGHIYVNDIADQVSGAIECRIHAENVSNPVSRIVPVSIHVRDGDVKAYADCLINQL